MNWNQWIRQTHRWVSIAFTIGVIVNGVAVAMKKYTNAVGLDGAAPARLPPLHRPILRFILPYAARWGRKRPV